MSETYLAIMLQSLKKKEQVLDEIIRLNDLQKKQLTDQATPVDDFDKTVEDKSASTSLISWTAASRSSMRRFRKNCRRTRSSMPTRLRHCRNAFAA